MNFKKKLIKSFKLNSNKIALIYKRKKITYEVLLKEANYLTSKLNLNKFSSILIVCQENFDCYKIILASLLSSTTYTPISSFYDINKKIQIINESNSPILYSDNYNYKLLFKNKSKLKKSIKYLYNFEKNIIYNLKLKKLIFIIKKSKTDVLNNKLVYIFYTSGTTGKPKAIPINEKNLFSYIKNISKYIKIKHWDICSANFDIGFDLSVHDLILTWINGASLCVPTKLDFLNMRNFINSNKITVWFSVPSLIGQMINFNQLNKDQFKSIRISLFCGEPLYNFQLIRWSESAPNSRFYNLYGPTETTIAISIYQIKINKFNFDSNTVTPIGKIFDNHKFMIIDESTNLKNNFGELLISGPQVTKGYLNNNIENRKKFIKKNYKIWYRTGDIVRLANKRLIYIGRNDRQLKINGIRVEAQEIEEKLMKFIKNSEVILLNMSFKTDIILKKKLVLFINKIFKKTDEEIFNYISNNLPKFCIPHKIVRVKNFPTNKNGKIDISQLENYAN